ncbi:Testosterone 17-beta-dehydrogenase 3 [Gracilariopsis chorda]|uniref:Testosterone 17-beta-dehydrogenase 3 n=1 Tax=Gracilariopsis chorda TaxID=448386 RepID=A0A2V3IUE2_9FLOR|nr:Testosterone 17-beta-dehydrogenase 3 [Gracilariopsis chorda]|eukprot:PXF45731.1 Testosterone 17-beta-dehydrogenase 3 [Gracilariopsis chorda]
MVLIPTFSDDYGPWALLTGASSGIGAEFVRQLAPSGLKLILVARRKERMQQLSHEVENKYGTEVKIIATDLANESGWQHVVSECENLEIGLLINNAGMQTHGSFFRDPVAKHLDIVKLNSSAVVALTHAFGSKMVRRKKGGIIITSSISSTPIPWVATYCASKSFASTFGRSIREELLQYGVGLTVLEPAIVTSEMSAEVQKTVDMSSGAFPEQPVEECVSEALDAFMRGRPKIIPGLRNRLQVGVMRSLPEALQMRLLNADMERAMDEEVKKSS